MSRCWLFRTSHGSPFWLLAAGMGLLSTCGGRVGLWDPPPSNEGPAGATSASQEANGGAASAGAAASDGGEASGEGGDGPSGTERELERSDEEERGAALLQAGIPWEGLSGLEGLAGAPGVDCIGCLSNNCSARIDACLEDSACTSGMLCASFTCSADDLACRLACFEGDLGAGLAGAQAVGCVAEHCGDSCVLGPTSGAI